MAIGTKEEAAPCARGPSRGGQEVLDANSFLQLVMESGAALNASPAGEATGRASGGRAGSGSGQWQLLFRQTHGSYKNPATKWLLVNENATDTSSGDYSILQHFEDFRLADGTFRLKLVWPGSQFPGDQIWRQTSNPVTRQAQGVDGYVAETISYTTNYWGGLEPDRFGNTLLDGSVNHSNWFYAVGTRHAWAGGIPGPYYDGAAPSTELYAWVEDSEASSVGDPHVTNIAHEQFDIRADGEHKLVQIPHVVNSGNTPDLRVDAVIHFLEAGSCEKAFMTSMNISGRWAEGPFHITRGSNTNTTLLINMEDPAEFFNRSHFQFVDVRPLALTFKLRDVGFHVGKHFEGRYGNQQSYLNVRITGLTKHKSVGGLLGLDSHEAAERPPANCTPARVAAGRNGSSLIGKGRSMSVMHGGSRIVAE